ncbi:EpsG family protein [Chryseobacterium sp. SIMBA_028]|uniref:EpsG family protein n=1 Tax=Chryseobacterium sp. SIMBA_028 TaxID=3085771 RepID=UPI003978C729
MDIPILIVYILSVLLLIFFNKSINRSFGALYVILVFSYLIGTRTDKVPDTIMYLAYWGDEDSDLSEYRNISGFEPGFRFVTKVIKLFTEESSVYMGTVCFINMLIICYASKKIVKDYNAEWAPELKKKIVFFSSLFLLLYIAFFGLYANAILMRVSIAYSIIYAAAAFALDTKKNKYLKYLIVGSLFGIATTLHTSAIFGAFILITLLFSKQLKKEVHIGILVVAFLMYFLNLSAPLGVFFFQTLGSVGIESSFLSKLGTYSTGFGTFEAEGFSLKFLFFFIMCFILVLKRDENQVYYKLLNVLTIGILIYSLFRSVLLVERITDHFTIYSFPLFYIFLSKKNNISFWIYLIAIIFIQMIFALRIINETIF